MIFVDNNSQKWETMFCQCKVISPMVLEKEYKENKCIHIVITAGEGADMIKQLLSMGIDELDISIFDTSQINNCLDNKKFILGHRAKITDVFELLQDEYSKKVYLALLNYRLTLDFNELKGIYDNDSEQYFAKDIISFRGDEVFVDAGTYDGMTIKEYMERCNNHYGQVICFEADEKNVSTIKKNFSSWGINRAEIYHLGLWSHKTTLKFDAIGSGSGRISEKGTVFIEADSLDSVLAGYKIDFIKMDIEGAEIEALKGASKIIGSLAPTLAISIYHNPEDIFAIPLLIHKLNPDYKLYIRHYRQFSAQETICYAISSR